MIKWRRNLGHFLGRFWPALAPPPCKSSPMFLVWNGLHMCPKHSTTSFLCRRAVSQNPLSTQLWYSGFLIYTLSSNQINKDHPWHFFQFRCTFQANVNSNLGKISLQAVCHPREENLTGVSEKYNWNFDTNPTYWVVRYSVKHSRHIMAQFFNVRRMPMNPKDIAEKYEKIEYANTWSKNRNPQKYQDRWCLRQFL